MKTSSPKIYDPLEEKINIITHLAGCFVALSGLVIFFLVRPPKTVACSAGYLIYGVMLVLMYVSSAWYHSRKNPSPSRELGRRMDHCAIFMLIAGTYTPVMLLFHNGEYAMQVLPVIWGCAVLGIFLNVFFFGRFIWFSILLYLVMGWYIILYIRQLLASMPFLPLLFLAIGGAAFSIGVLFYLMRFRFSHALWHFFVLLGTSSQFFAIGLLLPK